MKGRIGRIAIAAAVLSAGVACRVDHGTVPVTPTGLARIAGEVEGETRPLPSVWISLRALEGADAPGALRGSAMTDGAGRFLVEAERIGGTPLTRVDSMEMLIIASTLAAEYPPKPDGSPAAVDTVQ